MPSRAPSTTVVPVTLPDKPDALNMLLGRAKSELASSTKSPPLNGSFRRDSTWEKFRKMKKFNQTPYKLPPPTPIHVPAEKRPLEEKALPKKRVRITPVMRRIPDVPEPVQIPVSQVPQSPVQIPVSQVLEPPVQIPLVPQSPVQIPVSQVLEPPVQIPNVPQHVQIPDVPEPVQIPVSQVPQPPMNILHVSEPVQLPVSHVPTAICAKFYMYQNLCRFQCHKSHSHLCRAPEPMQLFPELGILDPLESTDAFDQLMSFVYLTPRTQLLHTVPSIFDENLFSFLDEKGAYGLDHAQTKLLCQKYRI
ncbi:hypothetical protein TNCV_4693251 [Trichonephila clavipes]|nr:hypothetical protein TNCV_4693251 [Trichonephila clavipes]